MKVGAILDQIDPGSMALAGAQRKDVANRDQARGIGMFLCHRLPTALIRLIRLSQKAMEL